jgi:tetratricopeptide (TPR) repeat protein
MGWIYQLTGREDEAVRLFEQARAENPDLVVPRLYLAAHYQAAGRHDEARALIQEALEVNPELSAEAMSRHGLWGRAPGHEDFLRNLGAAGLR